jgi:hypothetical protein
MAIGRISGSVLKSNLTRNGVDLAFETNLLYLDVTNSRVGIGTSEPSTALQVNGTTTTAGLTANGAVNIDGTGTSNMDNVIIGANTAAAITGTTIAGTTATLTNTSTDDSLLVTTTEDSSSAGPVITLKRNSSSPADADYLGQLKFKGENDADQEVVYAKITGKIQDASDGTEDGIIEIAHKKAGSNTITARFRSDSFQLLNDTTLKVANITYPTSDGSNGQVIVTDGAGTLSFADSSGGGGGNNTAIKQFNYYKLGTSSSVIDEFDITEFRGAVYDIELDDTVNSMIGHLKVSIIHDDSTPYISVYDVNEDSTRIADFTVAISGTMVQLSASTNTSTHTNLRIYRTALGDHHDTVANTNTKIVKTATNIGSTATTLDQFTTTDIQGAKYIILIKDGTAGDYQISEMSITHDGTTAYFNDYGKVSSRSTFTHTFSASISSSTLTLSSTSTGNTTGTAILYRTDLGSATQLGEYDNVHYGLLSDIDTTVKTLDSFDVFKYRSAKYLVNIGNSGDTKYQNSEITLTVNGAGTDATISESVVRTGTSDLATFTADVSSGKARLRISGSSANNTVYFARKAIEADNVYRASADTSDNLYITHNNIQSTDTQLILSGMTGALTLPSGTSGQQPTGVGGMIRYNSTTGAYEKYDTSSSAFVDITTSASTSTSDVEESVTPSTALGTSQGVIQQFTTSSADSAFYYAVTRDEINNEVSTARYSVVHNNTAAFVTQSHMVESGDGTNDHISVDADISSGNVRLLATGASVVNSVSLYKISLGDNTSASSSGNVSTIINSDVDSSTENLDTWAHASYRGAKYFISVNADDKTELSNLEALVTHNGTDAFITIYNEHYTGNNSLITLTADISGSNVRLRGAGLTPNLRVTMYRILLSDSESASTGDNVNVVAATTVSSTATTVDSFSTDDYTGAFYILTGTNSSEGASSIQEVMVVTDGSDAYVGAGPIVSTKGTDQFEFTASLSGTTVSLKASSTSGSSTTVNAYRVHLLRGEAGAATSNTVLIDTDQTITGAKTFSAAPTFSTGYNESINALTSSSTITVDCSTARVHTVTLGTNTEFNITSLPTGGTVTLIITQDGTGSRTATFGTDGSAAVKFPASSSVLSTGANDIDVVSIFNDGTNFLGNIARNYG